MCFFTVFTFYDPPLARVCHVLFEVFSFHGHKTIFVGANNNFERASFQVSLFKTITNVGIKRVIAFQTNNKGEGVLVSTSLAKKDKIPFVFVNKRLKMVCITYTPFAVHYEKIRNHLR